MSTLIVDNNNGDLADVEYRFRVRCSGNFCVTKSQKIRHLVMQPPVSRFAITVMRMLLIRLAGPFSIFAAEFLAASIFALEVTEPAAAAHGYPALYNLDGKKLADGEFRQWVEDHLLQIVITYKFPDGESFEEKARFRQQPELVQEHWSWKELKNERVQREFTVDFLSGMATAHISKDNKDVSDKVDIEKGRTFAGFGFTLALSNLRKRLLRGEQVELKAVGFSPFPMLKPQVVTVKLSHGGLDRIRMSGRSLKGDRFVVHPEVPAIAKLFVTVPDTKVWLTNPEPAGFLRWEGPSVLPNDQLIRVDLLPGTNSGPAEPSKRQ
jgi:hypothetical protein